MKISIFTVYTTVYLIETVGICDRKIDMLLVSLFLVEPDGCWWYWKLGNVCVVNIGEKKRTRKPMFVGLNRLPEATCMLKFFIMRRFS